MTKPLVVVESPTKVRTIKKYLGKDYNVAATVGHIKDLPNKEMGIDIENDFRPKYKNIPGKQKIIKTLKQAAGDASDIYLAPDPDREGEAIAWHTSEILQKKGRKFYRVLFHELTKDAIHKAMASPESLDRPKYEAQQARRILDRLVPADHIGDTFPDQHSDFAGTALGLENLPQAPYVGCFAQSVKELRVDGVEHQEKHDQA